MSRTTKALSRLGIAGLAAVTLGAGVPAFFATAASAAPASTIDLEPETGSATPNTCTEFTVTLRDANGAQATESGTVTVRVSESPSSTTQEVRFCSPTGRNATTTVGGSTVAQETFRGVTRFTFGILSTTEGGANIQVTGTSFSGDQLVGDSGSFTFRNAPATASPTATTSPTASTSPTATPTATMSPSPSVTTSPPGNNRPPTPPGCLRVAELRLERTTITATGSTGLRVTTTPNSVVDVFAYTRPSTTFRVVRQAEVGADGIADFRIVPPANTRLFAQQRGCAAGPQIVLNVRTQLSLNVVRNGFRNYTFSGRALPARNGGLIVSLYRVTGSGAQILTSQTRASATTGTYVINRRFTGSGRFGFVVRTGQDLQNAPGASNVRSLLVF